MSYLALATSSLKIFFKIPGCNIIKGRCTKGRLVSQSSATLHA